LLLKINQIIRLNLEKTGDYPLKARVADLTSNTFTIEIPINEKTGNLEPLPEGAVIMVWYQDEALGQYSFITKVIGIKKEKVPFLILEMPNKNQIERIQRRGYLRVPVKVEASYKLISHEEIDWNIVHVIDLSGGGLQFILPTPNLAKKGEEIECWLILPFKNGSIEHIKFLGEIVRAIKPNEESQVYWVSVKFTNIKEAMRAKIIRFVYERQVQLRNKGIIEQRN